MFKIFISYNHNDESVVNEFLKFTAPIRLGQKQYLKHGMIVNWIVDQFLRKLYELS